MNDKGDKNKAVPKLRFPEFYDDGEWEEKQLENVATFLKGKGISKSDITQNGAQPCIRYGELYTHYSETINSVKSYTDIPPEDLVLSQANDVIIPASGETHEDIATASCIINNGIALGGDLNIIRTKMDGVFLSYYLNNVKKKDIAQLAQGISVVHLYSGQLKKLHVNIPELKEQQKIASCLSSIDEFITAQTQKLDALKAHKNGLMQQLFPAEGERVPKLRFEEFRDKGEWEKRPLGDVAEIITGNTPSTIEPSYYGGNKLFVSPGDISEARYVIKTKTTLSEEGYSHTRHVKENSIIFVCIGSTIGKVAQNKFECATNQQLNSVVPYEGYFSDFLYSALENIAPMIASIAGIQAVPIINKTLFSSVLVNFPTTKEQQKIADCLSSLDELITAQSQKLEALKLHKKGLMQQLFPNADVS
jgi:type I restriction enzyme, S subunit